MDKIRSAAEMYAIQSISLSQLAESIKDYCSEHYCLYLEGLIMKAAIDYAALYSTEMYTWHEVCQHRAAPSMYTLASFATGEALNALLKLGK